MKIIDEKGRLFGRINIIDFGVLLLLFFIIPAFYFGERVFTKRAVIIQDKEMIEMKIFCNFIKIHPEILKLISVGDCELDKEGKVRGEITWVGKPKAYTYDLSIGSENSYKIDAPLLKEVPVMLKLNMEISDDSVYYKGQHVLVGQPFDFITGKYRLKAVPVSKNLEAVEEKEWLEVKVKFSSLTPELSKIITAGNAEKDKGGITVGRIKTVINSNSSKMSAVKLEEDKFVFIADPYHNDVTVLFEFLCEKKDGVFYFHNFPVRIGAPVTFSGDMYTISGIIMDMQIKK